MSNNITRLRTLAASQKKQTKNPSYDLRRIARNREFLRNGKARTPHYINVYEHSRAYGGPEEGGWYYDVYELVYARKYATRYVANNNLLKVTELVGDGYRMYVERGYAAQADKPRPYYC